MKAHDCEFDCQTLERLVMSTSSKLLIALSVIVVAFIYFNFFSIAYSSFNGSHRHLLDEMTQAYTFVAALGAIWGCLRIATSPRRKVQRLVMCAFVLLIPAVAQSSLSYIENNNGCCYAE